MSDVAPETQTARIPSLRRTEILDAALDQLELVGWRALRMRDVAERAGVSRQTVYKTFGNRPQLAASLVAHLTDRFLAGAELAFQQPGELYAQWFQALEYALREGGGSPALRAMLSASSTERFLELLTRGAEPLVTAARERLTGAVMSGHPQLNRSAVTAATEAAARLVISNIVLPLHPINIAARDIATMATAWIEHGGQRPARGRNVLANGIVENSAASVVASRRCNTG